MELTREAFLAAWDTATPFLQQDAVLQYLTQEWGMTLPGIRATLEKHLATVTTAEALFERLNHVPEMGIIPYAALLVLRPLVDPNSKPATAIAGDMTIAVDTAQVIFGSATISGSVHNAGTLIVFGDLTTQGIYTDAAWAYSLLAVGGSVRARGIVTYGDMLVQRDVMASEVVHGWYNDYSLIVGDTLRTRVLLEEYHHTHYTALEAQDTVHIYRDIPRLRELFADDLFTEGEQNGEIEVELDTDLLFDRLLQGQQIYRS
jgi:hypothetical protein